MSRMSNSWAMLKASATVLRLDTELLIFPLLSTLAVILITVSLVAPLKRVFRLHCCTYHEGNITFDMSVPGLEHAPVTVTKELGNDM